MRKSILFCYQRVVNVQKMLHKQTFVEYMCIQSQYVKFSMTCDKNGNNHQLDNTKNIEIHVEYWFMSLTLEKQVQKNVLLNDGIEINLHQSRMHLFSYQIIPHILRQ